MIIVLSKFQTSQLNQKVKNTTLLDFSLMDYIVNVRTENHFGQFVFSKAILIKKGIISTGKKEGKRGFLVYPKWDIPNNKHAEQTQKWQLDYFYEINTTTDLKRVSELYGVG